MHGANVKHEDISTFASDGIIWLFFRHHSLFPLIALWVLEIFHILGWKTISVCCKSRIWFVTPKNSHSIPRDIRSAEPRIRDSAVNVLLARHTGCKGFLLSAVHRFTIEADIWIH